MKSLAALPREDQLTEFFGNPGEKKFDSNFADVYLARFRMPFPLRIAWDKEQYALNLYAHRAVGPVMIDALKEIVDFKGHEYLVQNDFDLFGGCFEYRSIRGGDYLSTHSWGIALDLNPHLGPNDWEAYKAGTYDNRQPVFITEAFEKRGFVNLPWDRMHFQAVQL